MEFAAQRLLALGGDLARLEKSAVQQFQKASGSPGLIPIPTGRAISKLEGGLFSQESAPEDG